MDMIDEIKEDAGTRMDKSLNALNAAFARIRTGRANPALLDTVSVEYFGTKVPVKQVASITVEEGRTLVVSPWEKSTLVEIERAIQGSDLGLTPTSNGEVIRLPLPPSDGRESQRPDSACAIRSRTCSNRRTKHSTRCHT